MGYDVEQVRSQFPALAEGAAHFDGPGGSQVPAVVAEAVATTLTSALANRGVHTRAEQRADRIVHDCRLALADLLGADPQGIVFGRSMTQLTYDVSRALAKRWGPGDEVVVTRLDHDANVRPWVQAAAASGAGVRFADFDPDTTELRRDDVEAVLTDRTRLVAVTAASNLLGTRPPVADIVRSAHTAGALVYVDAVHAVPHFPVDLGALGADFVACSPYKFFGPHCGVVAGRVTVLDELDPDRLLPSTDDLPERFELGTLPYELMAGTTAAVEFLAGLAATPGSRRERLGASYAALVEHEDALRVALERGLADVPGLRIRSRAARRTPTTLFTVDQVGPARLYRDLAERGVNAPAGSFYALECSRHLGLGDDGGVRAGLAPYTNTADVDRLVEGVREIVAAAA